MSKDLEHLFAATGEHRESPLRLAAIDAVLRSMIDPPGSAQALPDPGPARRFVNHAADWWATATRRTRRGLVSALVSAVMVAGGGVAVAASGTGPAPVTDRSQARCYMKVSSNFGADFPGTTVGVPTEVSNGNVVGGANAGKVVAPIAACAEAWRLGIMQGIAPPDAHPPYPIPNLVGCVLPNGTAAVFPGPTGVCARLGLHQAEPG